MPSSPSFDDAMFVVHMAYREMQAKADPKTGLGERERQLSSTLVVSYGIIGRVLSRVSMIEELPTNTARRRQRLYEIYRAAMIEIASDMSSAAMVQVVPDSANQKPAEN